MMLQLILPARRGSRPKTTETNPHTQLNQHPDPEFVAELINRCFTLPNVVEKPTAIGTPGSRALWLRDGIVPGSRQAFLTDREFAHVHALPDGSVHLALPPEVGRQVIEQGWGEQHPVARMGFIPPTIMMVYAPRNEEELDTVFNLIQVSYQFAQGESTSSCC